MHCWRTVNIKKEFGNSRITVISSVIGLLSFLVLYLTYSFVHEDIVFKDHGVLPIVIGLLIVPMLHKLMHILPLILVNIRCKIKITLLFHCIPFMSFQVKSNLSKQLLIISLLAPTLCLTIPGLLISYLFANYFAYALLFISINIGLSFTDFIYTLQVMKAPKKCIVENVGNGYNILIKHS